MSCRHMVVARLGANDREDYSKWFPGRVATSIDYLDDGRLTHGLGVAMTDLARLRVWPTEIGVDLALLATLVHAADTRISRHSDSQDSWTREIALVVPVYDPALWAGAREHLERLLAFLTGDRWEVAFRARPATLQRLTADPGQSLEPAFTGVNLLSGGLDSLIGAIDRLEGGERPLFVSHCSDPATSAAQDACFDGLKAHYSMSALARLRAWISFGTSAIAGVEATTRGRSFLFFALGTLAATGLCDGEAVVQAPENGLIALNVPLDPLRLGSHTTRTTHPFFISSWNELMVMLGVRASVANPYRHRTKGEMVAGCRNAGLLSSLVGSSMSCSSPAKARWRGYPTQHCGHCVPCLIRRAALSVRLDPDPTAYTLPSLTGETLDTRTAEGEHVRSFQSALGRLARDPSFAALAIHKPGPLPADEIELALLADVYRRGMAEMSRLLAGVVARPS